MEADLDLSSPNGASVNDGIQKELCYLLYVKVDEVVEAILTFGQGTELAKIDIKSAYRIARGQTSIRHEMAGQNICGCNFTIQVTVCSQNFQCFGSRP